MNVFTRLARWMRSRRWRRQAQRRWYPSYGWSCRCTQVQARTRNGQIVALQAWEMTRGKKVTRIAFTPRGSLREDAMRVITN